MQATGQAIRFVVLGVPVAQPRQRHAVVGGGIRNYTPANHPVRDYKAQVRAAAEQAGLPDQLWTGPVVLECRFYLPRPQSLMRRKDADGPVPHTKKPDLGNLYKATEDALSAVLYVDDNQVFGYGPDHGKWYHEKAGRPRVEICVWEVSL